MHNIIYPNQTLFFKHSDLISLYKRFIYAEVIYFSKWWKLQNETMRDTVRDLVRNGRFEFINGGWCVHDEATTNYADVIDQMSLGLRYVKFYYFNVNKK